MKKAGMLALLVVFCLSLVGMARANSSGPSTVCLYCGNGFIDGNDDAWPINLGFATANTFTLTSPGTVQYVEIASWASPGDPITSIGWAIGTAPGFGVADPVFASGTSATTNYYAFTNTYGYDIYVDAFGTGPVPLGAGTYWLTLYDATTGVPGDPALWDMNDGPSAAWNSSVGYVTPDICPSYFPGGGTCSDAFVVVGTQGVSPEPGGLLLLGSGLLGLGGVLYRQAKRDV
jgi:hypothetical protein